MEYQARSGVDGVLEGSSVRVHGCLVGRNADRAVDRNVVRAVPIIDLDNTIRA